MGFRNGAFATVWTSEVKSQRLTRCRISISKKNRDTGAYDQTFSGYVAFAGSAAASKAARLHEKDRIKLLEVDVENSYDKENKKEYTNFLVYDFEMADNEQTTGGNSPANNDFVPIVDEGEVDDEDLPF